jgi:hypothetical protein
MQSRLFCDFQLAKQASQLHSPSDVPALLASFLPLQRHEIVPFVALFNSHLVTKARKGSTGELMTLLLASGMSGETIVFFELQT